MIRIRGGSYDVFDHCRTLQKIMSWARRTYCLRSNEPLELPVVPSTSRYVFDETFEDMQSPDDLSALIIERNKFRNIISRELEELLDGLHILSSFPPTGSRTPAQRRHISYIIYDTEYKLIILNQSHLAGLSGLSTTRANLSKSFQLAVQIYVMAALRKLQPQSALVQRYVKALKSDTRGLQLPGKGLDLTSYQSWAVLLLWIETVLAVTTVDENEKTQCVSILRELLKAYDCTEMSDFIGLLKEVCWLDGCIDEELSDVWTTIVQCP